MKLCYLIMVHHKAYQFEWLFKSIYNEKDYFLLNVESNSSQKFCTEICKIIPNYGNIYFLPRLHCGWGGFSLCQSTLLGIKTAVDWRPDWSYLINLSGQCYPLKSRDERIADLLLYPNKNYVELLRFRTMPQPVRRYVEKRLQNYYIEIGGIIRNSHVPRKNKMQKEIEYYGSDWFMLTRSFCEWIVATPYLNSLLPLLRFAKLPSEMMMQYLVTRDEFLETVAPHYLRDIIWSPGNFHPDTLTISHKERLLQGPAHFARKFDAVVDDNILHLLADRVSATLPDHRS